MFGWRGLRRAVACRGELEAAVAARRALHDQQVLHRATPARVDVEAVVVIAGQDDVPQVDRAAEDLDAVVR